MIKLRLSTYVELRHLGIKQKTSCSRLLILAIAMKHQVSAKLENRYMKGAIICDANYRRIGRIWHLDENMPIYWDIRAWISHYESANTISEAVRKIVNLARVDSKYN